MPGQGSFGWFDGVESTGPSEWDSRYGTAIDTLQLHHATMTSLPGLIDLMMPGGRQVSANGAMGNDGVLIEVVPSLYRAFTSASVYDRRCITVECCNTTLAPDWGISEATHVRAARLAVDMFQRGMLGGLNRTYIIGHNEVPGSYPTACPGPSFNLDHVVELANAMVNPPSSTKGAQMLIFKAPAKASDDGQIVANGRYLQADDGILRPISDSEFGIYDFFTNKATGANRIPAIIVTTWDSNDIRNLTRTAGLRESNRSASNPVLTGKIIYNDPAKAAYPPVSAPAPVIDYDELASNIVKRMPTKITGQLTD